MDYQVLKNRLTNGHPFIIEGALARINALADNLAITQEQATELIELAKANGVEALPTDYVTRMDNFEQRMWELEAAVMELGEMVAMINA